MPCQIPTPVIEVPEEEGSPWWARVQSGLTGRIMSNSFPVFVRSFCRNPIQVGAVAPSSPALSRGIASLVTPNSSHVIELGAGTGSLTEALLLRGIAPERFWAVEIDPFLAAHLRCQFPGIHVVCGDARRLVELLPRNLHHHVSCVVSGLPLRNMDRASRSEVVNAALEPLETNGQLLQFTYGLSSPIAARGLGITAERVTRVWDNLPPATIWRYRKTGPKRVVRIEERVVV
jgi:phosphatidylethanolamine/phosphatidyl-N-methylethanolamine N-methyltransferase